VLPPDSKHAAIPLEATVKTMRPCKRKVAANVSNRNVLPQPPAPPTTNILLVAAVCTKVYNAPICLSCCGDSLLTSNGSKPVLKVDSRPFFGMLPVSNLNFSLPQSNSQPRHITRQQKARHAPTPAKDSLSSSLRDCELVFRLLQQVARGAAKQQTRHHDSHWRLPQYFCTSIE
jgi:hypothetical protein